MTKNILWYGILTILSNYVITNLGIIYYVFFSIRKKQVFYMPNKQ